MPTFDIVSKVDLPEVDNAVQNLMREVGQRFDFKNSKCSIVRDESALTVLADDDYKLRQLHDLLRSHLTRRKVDAAALEFKEPERASGDTLRQTITIRQGVPQDIAKRIVKGIKDGKLKVQASIQGEEVRITGKSRNDLQSVIALVKDMKTDFPLQYVNFRD